MWTCTVFRERDTIKYKSIKAAKQFQSSFQLKFRKLKYNGALQSKEISKVNYNACTKFAWFSYLFEMRTLTVFRERVSIKSSNINAENIFQFSCVCKCTKSALFFKLH